jgi:hypothetical protein
MSKYYETIFNVQTGETTTRDYTEKEIAELEAEAAKIESERFIAEAKAKTKEAERAELLARLGITADEAKLLLG